jgi:hypothetical protein
VSAALIVERFHEGLRVPTAVELSGEHPWVLDPGSASVRYPGFAVDWLDHEGNILFHFNPRPAEDRVVLNSYVADVWGQEEVLTPYPFRREPDTVLRLGFEVSADSFRIAVDGSVIGRFSHRAPPADVTAVRTSTFLWRLGPSGTAVGPEVELDPTPAGRQKPVRAFRFFAVLGAWMEEDVIAATVANCLTQGCERVYLVDNESPDRTVERALAEGAVLARTFSSERYDELERIGHMQAVVDEVSAAEGDKHVWWLFLDADEFHHGPRGLTLRDYLATLDRRYRLVGARFFNHFPRGEPAYVEGRHPLDVQPRCHEIPFPICDFAHYKHPLQRWDADGSPIKCGWGFHNATCAEALLEPALPVFLHHFPYRAKEFTKARLERLVAVEATRGTTSDAATVHMRRRFESLDAVYAQRWRDVELFPPGAPGYAPELRSWEAQVDQPDRSVARWY